MIFGTIFILVGLRVIIIDSYIIFYLFFFFVLIIWCDW